MRELRMEPQEKDQVDKESVDDVGDGGFKWRKAIDN